MKSVRKEVGVTLMSSAGVLALNFLTGVLTARLLNPSGRGAVAALSVWAQTLGFVFAFGFTEAVTFLQASKISSGSRLFGTTLLVTVVCGTMGFGVGELILPHVLAAQSADVIHLGRLFLLTIYLVIATETAKALVSGDQDFRFLNAVRFGQPFLYAVAIVALWLTHRATPPTILVAATLTGAIALFATWGRLVRRIGLGAPSLLVLRQGFAFGLRQQGANFSRLANSRLDLMLMPAFLSAAQVGLYAVAGNLSLLIFSLLGSLSLVIFPVAARVGGDAGLPLVGKALRLALFGGLLLCGALCVIAPLLIGGLYGASFLHAVLPLRILLLGAVFMAATAIVSSGLQAINRPLSATVAQVCGAIVTAVGLALLLRPFGIVGAALTSTVSYGVCFVVALVLLGRQPAFALSRVLHPRAFAADIADIWSSYARFLPPSRWLRRGAAYAAVLLISLGMTLIVSRIPGGGYQFSILLLALLPAVALAWADAPVLIVYILGVWAFGSEARRLFDWAMGEYQSVSPLSLLPVLATLTLLIPILRHNRSLPGTLKKALWGLGAALAYGAILGAAHNGMAFLFDLANYAAPLVILLYAAQRPPNARERDGWLRGLAALAVLAAIYGWIQYLVAPPWDTFWMKNVAMNSIGSPEPLKIRVFSTLNAPGPAGAFFAAALAPMLFAKNWRGPWGWFGVVAVAGALSITLVRSSWLSLLICAVAYALTLESRQRLRPILGLVALGALVYFAAPLLPGGSGVAARAQTFGDLHNDYSYNDRQSFSAGALTQVLANPLGAGLGSVGGGTRLEHGGQLGQYGVFDNGLLAVLMTFGLPGSLIFFGALLRIGFLLRAQIRQVSVIQPYARLALAAVVAGVASLSSGNCFPGLPGALLWFLIGLAFAPAEAPVEALADTRMGAAPPIPELWSDSLVGAER